MSSRRIYGSIETFTPEDGAINANASHTVWNAGMISCVQATSEWANLPTIFPEGRVAASVRHIINATIDLTRETAERVENPIAY